MPSTEFGELLADMQQWRDRANAAEDDLHSLSLFRREIHRDLEALKRAIDRSTGMVPSVEQLFTELLRKLT